MRVNFEPQGNASTGRLFDVNDGASKISIIFLCPVGGVWPLGNIFSRPDSRHASLLLHPFYKIWGEFCITKYHARTRFLNNVGRICTCSHARLFQDGNSFNGK